MFLFTLCARVVFFTEVYYALVSYFSLIMPPRPANRRNRAITMDPKLLMLAKLNALPRNSLILLASARNLVTEGTRSRLAHRIFEHEHANNPAPQAIAPHLPASTENPGISVDPEPPSRSTSRQQPSSTPDSQFSPDHLSQLCELIAETVGSQRSGPGEAPGLLADVALLSLASPLNIAAITATEQNLNGVNLPNVIQDGGLSLCQFVPSLSQASQGPSQQIVILLCQRSQRNSARRYPNVSTLTSMNFSQITCTLTLPSPPPRTTSP